MGDEKQGQLKPEELKTFLDLKHDEFNIPDFIPPDPISIPHRFSRKEDIEISGLLTAIISWGRRDLIIRGAGQLMDMMWNTPYDFVMQASEEELENLQNFVYRTFQGVDVYYIVKGLRKVYREMGGLEEVMHMGDEAENTLPAIMQLREAVSSVEEFPQRTFKHLSNTAKGSSAKRINMYLRWMVRKDQRGVDFGIWNNMRPDQLICPLDFHTGNVGRKLGFVTRKANDWKSACELTNALKQFDPQDPVKYDFSLFGLGIYEKF